MSLLKLGAPFGDHMVLQRQKPLEFWGNEEPGQRVELTWTGAEQRLSATATADADGLWRMTLPPQAAGGPYELGFQGSSGCTLKDVWVGEVWLASGQSNMEWTVAQASDPEQEIESANNPRLRFLYVERTPALSPNEYVRASWQVISPDSVGRMTAVGYAFARHLFAELGVAIGIIDASWGGTLVEAWTSSEALSQVMDLDAELSAWREEEQELGPVTLAYQEQLREFEREYLVADTNNRGEAEGWHEPEPVWDDPTLDLPMLWQRHGLQFNGAVWFRLDIELPADWVQPSTLHLGRIDDFDHSYVNGVLVGSHPQGTPMSCDISRSYPVPEGLLVPGKNTIAVRVFDHVGEGGFIDAAGSLFLESSAGQRIPLGGAWQYRVERAVPLVPQSVWAHYPPTPRILRPQDRPTALYNGMIAPLLPFSLSGVIWYQGESNAPEHKTYLERFSALIRDWQTRFASAPSPNTVGSRVAFYFVQLANFEASQDWAYLREAQAEALREPDTGMVVTIDIGDRNDIHPRNKREVGRRLALIALKDTYGLDVGATRGPVATEISFAPGEVLVSFTPGSQLATSDMSPEVLGFELEAPNGAVYAAPGYVLGDQVRVVAPFSELPNGVYYAFRDAPRVNLVNAAGLPAEPFRRARRSSHPKAP